MGTALTVSSKIAIVATVLLTLLALSSFPSANAQSQYRVNDLDVLVTVLDDRSARVVMDYNFTWLQTGTYVSTWNILLDTPDPHGVRVQSQGRDLGFTMQTQGDVTSLWIELGRDVYAGEAMVFRVEYVTSSSILSIGPERQLTLTIWEIAPKDRVNLTVVAPAGFQQVSHQPSFLQGSGGVLSGTAEGVQPGINHLIEVSYAASEAVYDLTYVYTFTNQGSSTEYGAEFEVPIYAEAPHQTVTRLSVSPDPISSSYDESGNYRSRFRFGSIPPGGSIQINVSYSIRVSVPFAPDSTYRGGVGTVPLAYIAYTQGDEYWEVADPSISALASNITAGKVSVLEMSKAIYDYVVENIEYDYAKYNLVTSGLPVERYGAVKTLELGRGVCEDMTDFYVALCRAAGIPAIEVVGFSYEGDCVLGIGSRHAWAGIYIPDYGWMDVDPTWKLFGSLEGRHVGDRLFMNSSEPSYLVWNAREPQSFTYGVSTRVALQAEGSAYVPELALSAELPQEVFTGTSFPIKLTINNLGNGTAFAMDGDVTWTENIEAMDGSFFYERVWGYDFETQSLLISPKSAGNATVWVHLEYMGEGGGLYEGDYSYSFLVTERPFYSIESLTAALDPVIWMVMGGGIALAVLACIVVWGIRRR